MSFASISDFNNRYDSRVIAQLSNDTNSTAINNTVVQACLDDGNATILTAALQGSQYTVSDLASLLASGDTTLIRMNCDIALKYLSQRRGMGLSPGLREQVKDSFDLLDALRKGTKVFNVASNRNADTPAMVNITSTQSQNIGDLAGIDFFGGPSGTMTINGQT